MKFPPPEVIRGSPLKTIQSFARWKTASMQRLLFVDAYHALRVLITFWKSYSPCDRRYPSLFRIRSEPWTAVAWEVFPKSQIWTLPQSTWDLLPSFDFRSLPRKEVIQPHLPIRLPCYDFTPVIGLALGGWLLSVTSPTLGTPNSHGVTGGVYKARERIHRGMLIRDY